MPSIFEELMRQNRELSETQVKRNESKSIKIPVSKVKVESRKIFEEEDLDELDTKFAVDKDNPDNDEVVLVIDPELPAEGEEEPEVVAEDMVGDLVYKCPVCGANYVCDCDAEKEENIKLDENGVPVECPICGDETDQILIGEIAPAKEAEKKGEEVEEEPVSAEDEEEETEEVESSEEVEEVEESKKLSSEDDKDEKKEDKEECEGCHDSKTKTEDLGQDVSEYQKWVDYDMERYGKISGLTNRKLNRAGLTVVRDKYGDYEVIAHRSARGGRYESKKLKEYNYVGPSPYEPVPMFDDAIERTLSDYGFYNSAADPYTYDKYDDETVYIQYDDSKGKWYDGIYYDTLDDLIKANKFKKMDYKKFNEKNPEYWKNRKDSYLSYFESKKLREGVDPKYAKEDKILRDMGFEWMDKDRYGMPGRWVRINDEGGEGHEELYPPLTKETCGWAEPCDTWEYVPDEFLQDNLGRDNFSFKTFDKFLEFMEELDDHQYFNWNYMDHNKSRDAFVAKYEEESKKLREGAFDDDEWMQEQYRDYILDNLPDQEVVRIIKVYGKEDVDSPDGEALLKAIPEYIRSKEGRTKYKDFMRNTIGYMQSPGFASRESKKRSARDIEFDERRFESLIRNVISENYEGTPKFKVARISSKGNNLKISYTVTEGKKITKGTMIARGYNPASRTMKLAISDKGAFTESLTKKPAFIVECVRVRNVIVPTKLSYDFKVKVNESYYRVVGKSGRK